MIRVAVTGGRDFRDFKLVERALNFLHMEEGISAVFHGKAPGADRLCVLWAVHAGRVAIVDVPAYWRCLDYEKHVGHPCRQADGSHRGAPHGKPAGPARNRRMLTTWKPDLLVAFPGGTGTANCVAIARELRINVLPAVEYVAACMSVSSHQPASGGAQCKAHPRPPS